MKIPRGKLFILEGISGCGKGKQVEFFKKKHPDYYFDYEPCDWLYGRVARLTFERKPVPKNLLRECLSFGNPEFDFWKTMHSIVRKMEAGAPLDELEIQLFIIADRIFNLETKYLPRLEKGINVVLDRYYHSLLAIGNSGGLDMGLLWNWQMKAFSSSRIISNDNWKPDLTIIFDLDARVAMERLKSSGKIIDIFEEKVERLAKMREIYKELADRKDLSKKTVLIDANQSPEKIFELVSLEIDRVLKVA